MREFKVEITEIIQITVDIEAKSREKAVESARFRYDSGEFAIDSSDLLATEFEVV